MGNFTLHVFEKKKKGRKKKWVITFLKKLVLANFLSQFGKFLSLKKKKRICNKIFPFEKYLQNKKTELHTITGTY
jgi:hypothetical protein